MDPGIKAMLISIGGVDVDESLLYERLTTPSSGPGAGLTSFFFRSGSNRVRLGINKSSPLKMVEDGGAIVILKDGEEIVRGEIESVLQHCPEQVYITVSERCIFDCKFCPVPKLRGRIKSDEEIIRMVEDALETGMMKAISITSGVAKSPDDEVERVVRLVKKLKRYGVPIGVSVCPTSNSSKQLKYAGATEIKYNVETMDRELFKRVCGDASLDFILESLRSAVDIFGRNRVFSNFIIGLGESDESVREGVEYLAGIGVIPILRAISPHPLREGEININRPSADRLLALTKMSREILDKNGLRADISQTMCLQCTGCDITPHRDL
ncbi:MAG: radical SAM protein [Halobacteriota archaeon]|nr:radical SAM protein [Halobacteriota archaeon]